MRKLKLMALAFVIGTASLFAMNSNPLSPEEEIRNEIVQLLDSPSFGIEKDISVIIRFTFNSQGEIVVLCAGCKDRQVVNYIRKNLNHKKFKNPGEKDKIYAIPLKIQKV